MEPLTTFHLPTPAFESEGTLKKARSLDIDGHDIDSLKGLLAISHPPRPSRIIVDAEIARLSGGLFDTLPPCDVPLDVFLTAPRRPRTTRRGAPVNAPPPRTALRSAPANAPAPRTPARPPAAKVPVARTSAHRAPGAPGERRADGLVPASRDAGIRDLADLLEPADPPRTRYALSGGRLWGAIGIAAAIGLLAGHLVVRGAAPPEKAPPATIHVR